MTAAAGLTSGPFRLHAAVPGDMISLAAEDDEDTVAAAHAALAGSWLPATAPPGTRQDMLSQLAAARQMVKDGGISWLGLTAGPHAGRWSMLLIAITVTPFDPPPDIAPAGLLAAMLRAGYPPGTALIEEFQAPGGPAVGIRRAGTLDLNGTQLTTGIAQALVIYPGPGALGIVSGICLSPDDLDPLAVLVAGIAARMTVTRAAADPAA